MGKRSDFKRVEKDYYVTPFNAVAPLVPFLKRDKIKSYAEPCAGNGALVNHLDKYNFVDYFAADIDPKEDWILKQDALSISKVDIKACDAIITNPPWSRPVLHDMIYTFKSLLPTWLLFDADWPHTKQSIPFMDYCSDIVPIGRLKWFEHSKHVGKDNCCWYKFTDKKTDTVFHKRTS